MKTCFVSMPLGQRADLQTGSVVDFDRVFVELVVPAVEEAQLRLLSWRSRAPVATSVQKQTLGDIMSSDVLLADVTTANPNVMYELGVRHAANRGPTVLLWASGGQPPFYVGYLQMILYDPLADLAHPEAARSRITEALRMATRRSDGSPVYEFFPQLRVELPAELRSADREHRSYPDRVKRTLDRSRSVVSHQRRNADVATAEEILRGTPDAAPAAYLDVLRAYRDASRWDELVRVAESLPAELERDPQVMQLVALALNRRSGPGDQDRAVAIMRKLVAETGGDAETFGILGRIYKERWRSSGRVEDLEEAAACYRRGFELQPRDYYTGFNAAALLFLRNDPAADVALAALLPRVKAVLQERLGPDETDYSVFSVAVEIAVMERQWTDAQALADRALALNPPRWMRVTSAESLARLGARLGGPDAESLRDVIVRFEQGAGPEDDEDA
jgi:tetratricopeptide (TPR) repeat protein